MPFPSPTRLVVTTAAVAASLVASSALPATAAARPSTPPVVTLTTDVVFPYQLAYTHGQLYVGDGGTSLASKVTSSGLQTVATGPQPGEVAGVAASSSGQFAYTSSDYATGGTALTVKRPGKTDLVADLSGYEKAHNPDGKVHYGLDHPTKCQARALTKAGVPVQYTGVVDSHPYAVTSLGDASWAVAEAAGNDILRVGPAGGISVIAVLPRQPSTITASAAAANHLPKCVVGAVYNFEPVPTDVEVGPDGSLYVSTLPGGPEDPSFGARGSVYKVNPATGAAHRLATGILGATNLAVTAEGVVYVAGLFSGSIGKVEHGMVVPYLSLPGVASLVAGDNHLYAGTLAPSDDQGNPTGNGSIVQIH